MSAERVLKIAGGTGDDGVAAWLCVLEPLLKLPEPERRAIVEELENHLRERVRDQMLAGMTEGDAVRTAVAELGDAAALARRFREAGRTPLRRTAMNLAVLGVAGAAMVTSLVAIGGGAGGRHSPAIAVYQPQPAVMKAEAAAAKPPTVQSIEITSMALGRALETVAEVTKLKLIVRWERLQNEGVDAEHPVTIIAKEADLDRIFQMINEDLGNPAIDYRVIGNVLEVGPRSFFDKRDTELVSFDVSKILDSGVQPADMVGAITQMVEQDNWSENGGATGMMTVVGKRLFVKAPPRMWKKAAWMLDQLAPEAGTPEAGDKVPVLSDIPMVGMLFTKEADGAQHIALRKVDASLKAVRSQVAWQKSALGMDLTPEECTWLIGDAAVKVIRPDDPKRGEAEAALRTLQDQMKFLQAEAARLRAAGLR